jgi:transcriptional regulator with XRE-family HTH domain
MTIRDARKAAGLTQQKMADMMDIPKRTIEDWESERSTPPSYVEKLVIAELERIGKMMNEIRYMSIDEREHETYATPFETLEEANKNAESQWDHLTKGEQKGSHVYVLDVKRSDLDDPEDWESFTAGGYCSGRWDSENL